MSFNYADSPEFQKELENAKEEVKQLGENGPQLWNDIADLIGPLAFRRGRIRYRGYPFAQIIAQVLLAQDQYIRKQLSNPERTQHSAVADAPGVTRSALPCDHGWD